MREVEERRHHDRVRTPGGEAICHFHGFGEHYLLDDLSVDGARLRWGPLIPVGAKVHIVIFAGALGMISLDGKVIRHGKDGTSIGLYFEELDLKTEHALEDIVIEAQIDDYLPADYLENCPP